MVTLAWYTSERNLKLKKDPPTSSSANHSVFGLPGEFFFMFLNFAKPKTPNCECGFDEVHHPFQAPAGTSSPSP